MDDTNQSAPDSNPSQPTARERRRKRISWIIWFIVSAIYRSLRLKVENGEGVHPDPAKGSILVTWHGRSLLAANLFRNRGYWALISLSQDGELQNLIFQKFGFQTIRGSTGRGGVRGALEMAKKAKEGCILAFTPDGPRGPTHKVQLGVIVIAERSGAPIVPMGFSARHRKLMKSWDSYLIPFPFSRAYAIIGSPIYIPKGLDEAGRTHWARIVEQEMNLVEEKAEGQLGYKKQKNSE